MMQSKLALNIGNINFQAWNGYCKSARAQKFLTEKLSKDCQLLAKHF